MNSHWRARERPASLEARFVFDSYSGLRDFLDDMAEECERLEHHPNVSFGRDYASVMIYPRGETLADEDYMLADRIEASFHRQSQAGDRS